jgi:hypothetical protein
MNKRSGKYRALTTLPPKYLPSNSLTVFHAPTGPANNTNILTASVLLAGGGFNGWTMTRSTVPFFEHSSPKQDSADSNVYKNLAYQSRQANQYLQHPQGRPYL